MKRLLFILLAFVSLSALAQTTKTYTGPYNVQWDALQSKNFAIHPSPTDALVIERMPKNGGTATYSYYEDEDENRVFSGPFKFSGPLWYSNRNTTGMITNSTKHTVKVSGQYKDNKQVGTWTYDYSTPNHQVHVVATYADDMLNGPYKATFKHKKKNKQTGVESWVNGESFHLIFKDNIIVGMVGNANGITGSFDESGFPDGQWEKSLSNNRNYRETFKHGVLYSARTKDETTGDVVKKDISSPVSPKSYFDNAGEDISTSTVNGSSYILDEVVYPVAPHSKNGIWIAESPKFGLPDDLYDMFKRTFIGVFSRTNPNRDDYGVKYMVITPAQ